MKLSNDVHIQALNPKSNKIIINRGKLIKHAITMFIMYWLFKIFNYLFGLNIGFFWLGFMMQVISFKTLNGLVSVRPKYSILKSRALIKGEAYDLGREFLKSYQFFDFMLAETIDFLHNKEAHSVITDDIIDLPSQMFIRSFLPRVHRRMITYWGVDDLGCFYVIRSTFNDS